MYFDRFFTDLTRLLMSLLILGALGTLYTTVLLSCDPDAAVSAYHSIGPMAEHILAGNICYLAISLICTKIRRELHDGTQNGTH